MKACIITTPKAVITATALRHGPCDANGQWRVQSWEKWRRGRRVGFATFTSVAEETAHEEEYPETESNDSDCYVVNQFSESVWKRTNIPAEPSAIPATFCGFLRIIAVALSVLAPPVPPVSPGSFPLTPLLRITPPSTPVPTAADSAWARMEVVTDPDGLPVKADTGTRV